MRPLPLVLVAILLSGCSINICPGNLDLSEPMNVFERPDMGSYKKVMDKSVSFEGEVHSLKAYNVGNGSYYVEFQPIRSASSKLYGPFDGDPEEDLRCKE